MNDAGCMSRGECARDLRSHIENFAELYRRVPHALAQRLAVNELHGDEVRPVALTNLMDGRNVGMIERSRSFRFLNETAHAVLVCREVGGKNLQRNLAIEFCVLRQIHLAHPARAEFETMRVQ
jgi:hypothetical protein